MRQRVVSFISSDGRIQFWSALLCFSRRPLNSQPVEKINIETRFRDFEYVVDEFNCIADWRK